MRFQLKYVALPVGIFLLTLILAGFFYSRLPAETAYTFSGEGLPVKTAERTVVAAWIVGLQFIFTLGALLVAHVIALIFRKYIPSDSGNPEPASIISLMGNMTAIPQSVIFFTMLDIFSYNSYQIHLLPLWLNALIFLAGGGIVLSIFFIRAFLRIRRSK